MIQHGQGAQAEDKGCRRPAAVGLPLPVRGALLGATSGRRFRESGGGGDRARKVLDRLGPGGGRTTTTLNDLVEEYLAMHQAAPVGELGQRAHRMAGAALAPGVEHRMKAADTLSPARRWAFEGHGCRLEVHSRLAAEARRFHGIREMVGVVGGLGGRGRLCE